MSEPLRERSYADELREVGRGVPDEEAVPVLSYAAELRSVGRGISLEQAGMEQRQNLLIRGFNKVVDYASRGIYSTTGLVDTMLDPTTRSFANAWHRAKTELVDPEDRMLWGDLIRKHLPDYVEGPYGRSASYLGFLADLVVDPLNVVSPIKWTKAALRTGVRGLQAVGGIGAKQLGEKIARSKFGERIAGKTLEDIHRFQDEIGGKVQEAYAEKFTNLSEARRSDLARIEADAKVQLETAQNGIFETFASGFGVPREDVAKAAHLSVSFPQAPSRMIHPTLPVDELRDQMLRVANTVDTQFTTLAGEVNANYVAQIRTLAENRIAAMRIPVDPVDFAKDFGDRVAHQMDIFGDDLEHAGKRIANVLFSPELKAVTPNVDLIDRLSGVRAIGGIAKTVDMMLDKVNVERGLSESYKAIRDQWRADALRVVHDIDSDLRELGKGVSAAESRRVGETGMQIEFATRKAENQLRRALTDDEAGEIVTRKVSEAGLKENEVQLLNSLYQRFDDLARQEKEMELLQHTLRNYWPGIYDNINDPSTLVSIFKKLRGGLPYHLSSAEHKVIDSIEAARKQGLNPVFDAMTVYALRVMHSKRSVANKMFEARMVDLYPGYKHISMKGSLRTSSATARRVASEPNRIVFEPNIKALRKEFPGARQLADGSWVSKTGQTIIPSARVLDNIRYVGQGLYGPEGLKDASKWLRAYDRVLSIFRTGATVANPFFGVKQVPSNLSQVYLEFGAKSVFKFFDPSSMWDTAMVMSGNAAKMQLVDGLGRRLTGSQLYNEILDAGIMTNTVVDPSLAKSVTGRTVREVQKHISHVRTTKRMADRLSKDSEAAEGFTRFFMGALRYMDIPGHIEDFYRVNTYIMARRSGLDPTESAKKVNNALFPYLTGLSEWERQVARRIIPFYSFQRFAIPLIARVLGEKPARIANLTKITDRAFTAIGKHFGEGAELTPAEEASLSGYLLDQPKSFRGFTEAMHATFSTYSNFTPLDLLSQYLREDGGTETDAEWVQRVGLSQLSPILKVPIELVMQKDLFTGRSLDRAVRQVSGQPDPEMVMANLTGILAGSITNNSALGAFAGALSRATGEVFPSSVEFLKAALGWKEGVDPRTGDYKVYVSPWRIHVLTSFFPAFKEAFIQGNTQLSPLERTSRMLFGVGQVHLDLAEEQVKRINERVRRAENEQRRIQRDLVEATMFGEVEEHSRIVSELQELYNELGEQVMLLGGPVRGAIE